MGRTETRTADVDTEATPILAAHAADRADSVPPTSAHAGDDDLGPWLDDQWGTFADVDAVLLMEIAL